MNVFEIFAKLGLDSSEYESGLDKAKGLAGTAGKAMGTAIAAASGAVVAFGKKSVDAGMSFDKSMSQVVATMGNVDDMSGESLDKLKEYASNLGVTFDDATTATELSTSALRAFAQEMGSATAFSATQAADALNYMALAGYDATTSIDMLPNVLNLAAAGDMELARASDMITDASSALGLSLDETSKMVDKMAKASSKSNTSVSQLGDAILTVGGTAKNLKGGTTELATALGILADNGIKGAEGGTALRNILLNLTPKSEDAAAAFERIGLNAYDASGEMRPLADIFRDMNDGMAGMSTEERQNVLSNIFNKVDLKSVSALLSAASSNVAEMSAALETAGIQWDKYSDKAWMANSGIGGVVEEITYNLEILGSSAEEIQDYLHFEYDMDYEDAAAAIEIVNNMIGQSGDRWDELSLAIDGAWYTTQSMEEGLSSLGLSMEGITQELEGLGISAEQFQEALNYSGGDADILADILWEWSEAGTSFDDIVNALGGDMDALGQVMEETSGAAQAMADTQLDNLAGDITLFESALEGAYIAVSDGLTPSIRDLVQFGTDGVSRLTTAFREGGLSGAMDIFGSIIADGLAMLTEKLPQVVEAGMSLLSALVEGIIQNLPALAEAAVQIILILAQSISEDLPELIPTIVEVILQIVNVLTDPTNLMMLIDAAVQIILALAEGLIAAVPELIGAVPEIIKNLVQAIIEAAPELLVAAVELVAKLAWGIIEAIPELLLAVPELILAFASGLVDGIGAIIEAGGQLVGGLIEGIMGAYNHFIDSIKQFFDDFITSVKNFLGIHSPSTVFSDIGKNLINGLINGVKSLISNVIATGKNLVTGFVNIFKNLPSSFLTMGKNMITGLINGVKSMISGAISTVRNFAGSVIDAAKGALGIHSPSTVFAGIGKNLVAGMEKGWDSEIYQLKDKIDSDLEFDTSDIQITAQENATLRGNYGAGAAGTAQGYMDIVSALQRALQGMSVTMDGNKVGYLTTNYQTSRARAFGK